MTIYRDLSTDEFDEQQQISTLRSTVDLICCAFCGNRDLERMSEKEYICKRCGYGWNGMPANIVKTMKKIINISKYMIVQNPQLTNTELVRLIITKIHAVERHPTRQDGYCEYCQRMFK